MANSLPPHGLNEIVLELGCSRCGARLHISAWIASMSSVSMPNSDRSRAAYSTALHEVSLRGIVFDHRHARILIAHLEPQATNEEVQLILQMIVENFRNEVLEHGRSRKVALEWLTLESRGRADEWLVRRLLLCADPQGKKAATENCAGPVAWAKSRAILLR